MGKQFMIINKLANKLNSKINLILLMITINIIIIYYKMKNSLVLIN